MKRLRGLDLRERVKERLVRVFVSEWLTSGAWQEPDPSASLYREGAAMLAGISRDIARVPNCRVHTTWDARLPKCPLEGCENINVRTMSDPLEEAAAFDEECRLADAALIIAPEFDNLLAYRCRRAADLGTCSLNCSLEAIRLCTDKLQLAKQLKSIEIPTIPATDLDEFQDAKEPPFDFPLVVKPRDGAGSQETFLIANEREWHGRIGMTPGPLARRRIVQPFVSGRTLSVAALFGDDWLEVFPLAEQTLTRDGRFGYLGGKMPNTISLQHEATRLVCDVARRIPGLSGYVGFDLVAPAHSPGELWIVEINPRLTTSYIGYRELADGNLAEFLLPSYKPEELLRWKPAIVEFTADGRTKTKSSARTR